MPAEISIPRRVVVATHPSIPEAAAQAASVVDHLKARGLAAQYAALDDESLSAQVQAGEFDILVAIGGDGTMLRSAHLCAPHGVPILGINLGRFGFLIQVRREEWRTYLGSLLEGKFWIENRMMIRAEHRRAAAGLGSWHALNEVVVCRGELIRPVHISASADGRLLTRYVADGLIAATPTGSTAYALAAGGPILPPELRNILLVPIAPHLSVDRAVVLSEGSSVSISVEGSDNAVFSIDGQPPAKLSEGDQVDVRAGDYTAKFVRFGDPGYFYRNLTAHMNQNPAIGMPR